MSKKHAQQYTHRDPVVINRDPVIDRPPLPTVMIQGQHCPHCKTTTPIWEQGGTSQPNIETREMLRWRRCRDCKKTHWQRVAMTPEQVRQYSLPE